MNRRVVFVDDEPRILEGLEHMLHPMRHDWDMRFAQSGREALALLDAEPADVVISDMRMPEMGGVEFLGHVRQLHPSTVRIILSGQSDRAEIVRSVGSTHQFLAKPCSPESLKATIARACGLRDMLIDESLQRLVTQMETLPSLPSLYSQVVDEISCPDSSVNSVGAIMGRDVGMTAKILQLVNSSFFGLRRRVLTPSDAVRMLGMDTIKALVLSAGTFDQFDTTATSLPLETLYHHSFSTGAIAQAIARLENADRALADEALLAGCLHDIGKVILATNLPSDYDQLLHRSAAQRIAVHALEQQALGATHGRVGAYLLGLWGLSDVIVEAVAFHEDPLQSGADKFAPLTAVHVANALDHDATGEQAINTEYLELLGLAHRLPQWREAAQRIKQEQISS